jgi:hypothetical protein
MMRGFLKHLFYSIVFILCFNVHGQNNEGVWDTSSSFSQEVNLSAGEYRPITYKLPLGTTKVYYRVYVVSSLGDASSSFLKLFENSTNPKIAIPARLTQTSIKMSDPKINYSVVFASASGTNECFSSNGVITGEQINSLNENNCINTDDNSSALVFKFKSENSFFPLKIKFEIIPFINFELSRGWSKNLKNGLYNLLVKYLNENNTENYNTFKINEVSNCILVNVTKDYTLNQFKSLANYEMQNYFNNLKSKCDK